VTVGSTSSVAAPDAASVLADAWRRYAVTAAERLEVLDEAASALGAGRLDEELRDRAAAEAHRLAGSLGMFGVPEGSLLALECEHTLRADGPLGAIQGAQIVALTGGIRRELAASSGPE
jgi:HPt (histidine-containing phosphotransfer) domain-containing protein